MKELFEVEPPKVVRRSRHEMYKLIDGDYYGFRDDEDGVLEPLEAAAERALRAQVCVVWRGMASTNLFNMGFGMSKTACFSCG